MLKSGDPCPVVILAGGKGTRLREETDIRPKPMVCIGGKPILWHIMRIYSHYGYTRFIIALGYMGDVIKSYFYNYSLSNYDITIDMSTGDVQFHRKEADDCPWTVTLVDTGLETPTGGRIKKLEPYIEGDYFMATYGDGVANVDIAGLVKFHQAHGRIATLTAVRPKNRFGHLTIQDETVTTFQEKPVHTTAWINGGFFVFNRAVFRYLSEDMPLEGPGCALERLAIDSELKAYKHQGYWHCMDSYKEMLDLNQEWKSGSPGWKVWD